MKVILSLIFVFSFNLFAGTDLNELCIQAISISSSSERPLVEANSVMKSLGVTPELVKQNTESKEAYTLLKEYTDFLYGSQADKFFTVLARLMNAPFVNTVDLETVKSFKTNPLLKNFDQPGSERYADSLILIQRALNEMQIDLSPEVKQVLADSLLEFPIPTINRDNQSLDFFLKTISEPEKIKARVSKFVGQLSEKQKYKLIKTIYNAYEGESRVSNNLIKDLRFATHLDSKAGKELKAEADETMSTDITDYLLRQIFTFIFDREFFAKKEANAGRIIGKAKSTMSKLGKKLKIVNSNSEEDIAKTEAFKKLEAELEMLPVELKLFISDIYAKDMEPMVYNLFLSILLPEKNVNKLLSAIVLRDGFRKLLRGDYVNSFSKQHLLEAVKPEIKEKKNSTRYLVNHSSPNKTFNLPPKSSKKKNKKKKLKKKKKGSKANKARETQMNNNNKGEKSVAEYTESNFDNSFWPSTLDKQIEKKVLEVYIPEIMKTANEIPIFDGRLGDYRNFHFHHYKTQYRIIFTIDGNTIKFWRLRKRDEMYGTNGKRMKRWMQ